MMQYLRMLVAAIVVAFLLTACQGNGGGDDDPDAGDTGGNNPPMEEVTEQDFAGFVTQALAVDANGEPLPVNTVVFQNQVDNGKPKPVTAFLP